MDVILIECVVKGYHECGFTVTAGETCIIVVIVVEMLNSNRAMLPFYRVKKCK